MTEASARREGKDEDREPDTGVVARLAKLPLGVLALVGVLLPAGAAYSLVSLGLSQRSGSFIVLGALVGILWLAALAMVARRPTQSPAE